MASHFQHKIITPVLLLLALTMSLRAADALAADNTSTQPPTAHEAGIAVQEFPALYFQKFAPRTAREMLNQVPGFVVRELDDARGLGQATSNVLINGTRTSGKEDSALTALGRIPARAVVKILIRDGARSGIPGLSGDVADVIIDDTTTRGTWLWRTHHRDRLDSVWFRFDASLSGKHNALSWTANIRNQPDRFGHWGLEQVFDGNGELLEQRDEFASYNKERPGGSIQMNWSPSTGEIANLALSYKQVREDDDEDSRRTPVDGQAETIRYLDSDERRWVSELSADYEFDLRSGRLKLIAYQRFEHSPETNQTVVRSIADAELRRRVFSRDSDEGESIVRGEYRWKSKRNHDWQFALETVYNFVDTQSQLLESEDGAALVPVELDNSSSKIEERRTEAMLTHTRNWGDLSVQLSLGGEISRLEQSGQAGLSREFSRPKGFLSISRPIGDTASMALKLSRKVGQLDFFDFNASVNVDNQNSSGGNPELVPPQTWELELRFEQQYGEFGNATLRLWYEDIDDIVDFIPLQLGGEAVGNLDSAQRYGAQWLSTSYLDGIGFAGAQLTVDYSLQASTLDDPTSGESRRINGDTISYLFTELRHDVPATDWAWGMNYNLLVQADTFRRNEFFHTSNTRGELRAFVEHKNVLGFKARLLVRNLLDDRDQLERTVFDGSRLGQIEFVENRLRPYGAVFEFQLEGTF